MESFMKAATYRIASDDPNLPLIDWYLFLFDKADIARQRFAGRLTGTAIKNRLLKLRGACEHPDIAQAAALLPNPQHVLQLRRVLITLRSRLDLHSQDPSFPWLQATDLDPTIAPETLPWRMREQARFLTSIYTPVPWAGTLTPIPDHFAHLSNANPGLIAFTDTDAKGEADIQTPMKPGRYLAKFYPTLAAHEVRDIQEKMPRTAKLYFAVTADEIERVYTTGPGSCMSHPADHFDSPCHPVRVYGNSDLQLAYIKNSAGRPIARALVWPAKKRYARIYGHEELLRQQLVLESYERDSLSGARIRRINMDSEEGTVVMPYIDDDHTFDVVDDGWLVLGGPYNADSTDGTGTTQEPTYCCHCDQRISRDDDICTVGDETWCEGCRDNAAFTSDYSGDAFPEHERADVFIRNGNGRPLCQAWSESERDDHATYCDGSEEWYHSADFTFVRLKNGQTWLASYFAKHGNPADLAHDNENPPADSAEGRAAA
jgi:hypothetical protein